MIAGMRRSHHSLTDRLEDLGLAEVGDEQPEGKTAGSRSEERSGAGPPLDQAGGLELPKGAADGDPRNAEPLDELGLARQAFSLLPLASLDFAAESEEDGLVLEGVWSAGHVVMIYQLGRHSARLLRIICTLDR